MARYRLSRPAQEDIANILDTSAKQWGMDGRRRYATVIAAALRRIAAEPKGLLTRDRSELHSGYRSFHIKHARSDDPDAKVGNPVHVLFYVPARPGLIEVLRVLHERMEPNLHLGG